MSAIPEAAVAFCADLLLTPNTSMDHMIGQLIWPLLGGGSRDDVLTSLTDVMRIHNHTEGPQTRAFELAYEIWLLLGGSPVAA